MLASKRHPCNKFRFFCKLLPVKHHVSLALGILDCCTFASSERLQQGEARGCSGTNAARRQAHWVYPLVGIGAAKMLGQAGLQTKRTICASRRKADPGNIGAAAATTGARLPSRDRQPLEGLNRRTRQLAFHAPACVATGARTGGNGGSGWGDRLGPAGSRGACSVGPGIESSRIRARPRAER